MTIKWEWDDPQEKTIIRHTMYPGWEWEDFLAALDSVAEALTEHKRVYSIRLNLAHPRRRYPEDTFGSLRKIMEHPMSTRFELDVLVTPGPHLTEKLIVQSTGFISPTVYEHVGLAHTVTEARAMIVVRKYQIGGRSHSA